MREKDFVPYTLDTIGIYPYPEIVKLFRAFFNNTATKEQIDEVDKHIKATRSHKKVSEAYDYYQRKYAQPKDTHNEEK